MKNKRRDRTIHHSQVGPPRRAEPNPLGSRHLPHLRWIHHGEATEEVDIAARAARVFRHRRGGRHRWPAARRGSCR